MDSKFLKKNQCLNLYISALHFPISKIISVSYFRIQFLKLNIIHINFTLVKNMKLSKTWNHFRCRANVTNLIFKPNDKYIHIENIISLSLNVFEKCLRQNHFFFHFKIAVMPKRNWRFHSNYIGVFIDQFLSGYFIIYCGV